MSTIPYTAPSVWPNITPARYAYGISTTSHKGRRIALLGLPDDLGIRLNGGRIGAAHGPRAFRAALTRYGSAYDAASGAALPRDLVWDSGDIVPAPGSDADTLAETHTRVTAALTAIHQLGLIPVCIGGGHDLTFPTVRALAEHPRSDTIAPKSVAGINLDAHLDVRTEAGSGMPFRSLIEAGHLDAQRFVTLGAGRFANSHEHTKYLLDRGATIVGIDAALSGNAVVRDAFDVLGSAGAAFISIDLDGIDGSLAPGVSAVNPMGMPVSLACEVAKRAGAHRGVRHFDIMELCPPHDDPPWNPPVAEQPGRTARIAALLFLHFIAGFSEREA